MHILIDALSARVGGGVTYVKNILPALARQNRHKFTVLLSNNYQQSLIDSVPEYIGVISINLPAEPLYKRWVYLQTQLPKILNEQEIDIFYALAEGSYFYVPTKFVMLARNPSIYASLEAYGEQSFKLILHRLVRQPLAYLSLHKADRVIFVSSSFRDEIVQKTHLKSSKSRVVYHGLSPIFHQQSHLRVDSCEEPYFLSVSSVNPHKNYETLLKAYAHLSDNAPRLIIAGKIADRQTYQGLLSLISSLNLEGRVRFLGEVPYEELPNLYQRAMVFVMTSRLETFGHPLVEAMASGVPIVASNLPVCREMCQDAALYFDPSDVNSLVMHLERLMREVDLRSNLINRGKERAKLFSWEKSAQKLIAVFEELESFSNKII